MNTWINIKMKVMSVISIIIYILIDYNFIII